MEQQTIPQIGENDVLVGHNSLETAYVINDYPYGYRLRCKRRVWIEQATKGASVGLYRHVSQTTNPKKAGEVWNKPSASTYAPLVVMYIDQADGGHIKPLILHPSSDPTSYLALARVRYVLPLELQQRFDVMFTSSQRAEYRWKPWTAELGVVLSDLANRNGELLEA